MHLTYESTGKIKIGSEVVIVGRLKGAPGDDEADLTRKVASVYAAGHTEEALEMGRCGFGLTEAEAAVDYLRFLRTPEAD